MEDFAEQHDNEWLFRALKKQHPFAAFRNAVERANLLDQWYAFRDEEYRKQAQEWLDDNGIDFVDGRIVQLKEWKIEHGEHVMNVGEYAPNFTLQDKDGKTVSLSDFKGRKVVVYFYPKDNTPGCTAEACNLRDNYAALQAAGWNVVGVSKDSAKSHSGFRAKYELPFRLLADTTTQMLQDFGAWGEKKMYGKSTMGTLRRTFIFDEDGILERIIEKVDTKNAAGQILG